ncbi:hypothetical protein RRG08_060875 [Elysia crispata]|uniref:Uncharacterized protein n=1 Tax=Elysia crispata TaxID=231223 RepID=A0AAE0ZFS4_9GAST|nr:hypothetical protein RRG08_060875 [Elysia crispata]
MRNTGQKRRGQNLHLKSEDQPELMPNDILDWGRTGYETLEYHRFPSRNLVAHHHRQCCCLSGMNRVEEILDFVATAFMKKAEIEYICKINRNMKPSQTFYLGLLKLAPVGPKALTC